MSRRPLWLITGANGFLGRNAGVWLSERAHVVGTARHADQHPAFTQILQLDITDPRATTRVIRGVRPDVILNTAAIASHELCESDPTLAHRVNVEGAQNLAQSAAEIGARLIQVSTDAVFEGGTGGYLPDDSANPFSVYGRTKLLGEMAVLDAHPGAMVARTNFFGWSPSGTRSILEFFVNALTSGTPVDGFTDYIVSSIYAQDLMQVLWDLNERSVAGVVHAVARDAISKFAFGQLVAAVWDENPAMISAAVSTGTAGEVSRTRDLSLATEATAALLGYELPSQAEGVRQAFADRLALRQLVSDSH
ncbi:MAG TPA: hypothetical protein DDY88_05105 [Actinobacteria bacterium]|nr:hypothetical protein [Actinomycetota bacterium]